VNETSLSEGWLTTERTWGMLWAWIIGGPLVTLAALPLALFEEGLEKQVGLLVVVSVTLGTVLLELVVSFSVLNSWRPKRIRLDRTGVHIDPLVGRVRTVPWDEVSVTFGRPHGFGLLRYGRPARRVVLLSPKQYDALRQCPYLPDSILKPLEGGPGSRG
jgi:hypothetical protein